MVEQPPIGFRLGMVEFIDHNNVKAIRLDSAQSSFRERLNTGEHVAPLLRLITVNQELAESRLGEHLLIHPPRLQQDLFSVCDKQ